jgi:heme exporter protein CcmD
MNLSEFLNMGGYAAFVWPAYGLVFAVLAYNIWSARRVHTEARRLALRRLEIEETR